MQHRHYTTESIAHIALSKAITDHSKSLVTMDKVRLASRAVDELACFLDTSIQRSWSTTEDSDLSNLQEEGSYTPPSPEVPDRPSTYILMLLLHMLQHVGQDWPSEMVDGFQVCEHASALIHSKVLLADVLKWRASW